MKQIILSVFFSIFLIGCRSVEVPTVEPWEGRYPTVEEFREKTSQIELKSGQQIWVLSNGTMYRLLKKVEK